MSAPRPKGGNSLHRALAPVIALVVCACHATPASRNASTTPAFVVVVAPAPPPVAASPPPIQVRPAPMTARRLSDLRGDPRVASLMARIEADLVLLLPSEQAAALRFTLPLREGEPVPERMQTRVADAVRHAVFADAPARAEEATPDSCPPRVRSARRIDRSICGPLAALAPGESPLWLAVVASSWRLRRGAYVPDYATACGRWAPDARWLQRMAEELPRFGHRFDAFGVQCQLELTTLDAQEALRVALQIVRARTIGATACARDLESALRTRLRRRESRLSPALDHLRRVERHARAADARAFDALSLHVHFTLGRLPDSVAIDARSAPALGSLARALSRQRGIAAALRDLRAALARAPVRSREAGIRPDPTPLRVLDQCLR